MKRFSTPVALVMAAFLITNCNLIGLQEDSSEAEQEQSILGLTTGLLISDAQDLALNGSWNSFSGNATTSDTITTIAGRKDSGLWLDDSSGFGGYTSRYLIAAYDNSAGYVITQNPPNNGAYSGDTTKGKYFKIVFFAEGNSYWHCTLNGTDAKDTLAEARAIPDTADRSDLGSSGCGGFSWSRFKRVES